MASGTALAAEQASPSRQRIVIAIASAGRREILSGALPAIAAQTRLPDEVIVCVADPADVDAKAVESLPCPARIMVSARGSCRQRNAIIEELSAGDIALFLDDDFLMAKDFVTETERAFSQNHDVVLVTGTVVADGVTGPGIAIEDGLRTVAVLQPRENDEGADLISVYNGYGCNMAVRVAAIVQSAIRFDENLPLYGWLEDVDLSRRLSRHGRLVRSRRMLGIHLGVKSGRTPGIRFGYSQIANPVYLMRKRTMSLRHGAVQIARNFAANLARIWAPEPWVDRRGRLRGNFIAVAHLVTGRLSPRRVETLE